MFWLITYSIIACIAFQNVLANDGSYTGSGSSLTPIYESDISVKRELLTIKRIGTKAFVTVNYEMFNPGNEKTILVGFEASCPSGDATTAPVNGQHPYVRNFTAKANGKLLDFKIDYVGDYTSKTGERIRRRYTLSEASKSNAESGPNVDYVYSFNVTFKKGINTISHSYVYEMSSSVSNTYSFDYILTAANRWANKQIDDFTLILDLGSFENFYIPFSFFDGKAGWSIKGNGMVKVRTCHMFNEPGPNELWFYVQSGYVEFAAKNFHPTGELQFTSPGEIGERFSCRNYDHCPDARPLPFSISAQKWIFQDDLNDQQKQIYRAWPYARRGMIFKDRFVQNYFENCVDWYTPNPRYTPSISDLLPEEQEWIRKLR